MVFETAGKAVYRAPRDQLLATTSYRSSAYAGIRAS